MELREFALEVVESESLRVKLTAAPTGLTDDSPALAVPVPMRPGRPRSLAILSVSDAKVPKLEGMYEPEQRRRILHSFANHELQAVELFAWALLAYPDAPAAFRRGLLHILHDEQRHTQMYIDRLEALGGRFGDYPVSGYFWNKAPGLLHEPAAFVCAMSLTFEQANLDHSADYAAEARRIGDEETARLLDVVQADEIRHVAFGWRWLQRFKRDDESMWEAWRRHLAWPLQPAKAKGRHFNRNGRAAAGMDAAFIAEMAAAEPLAEAPPRHRARGKA